MHLLSRLPTCSSISTRDTIQSFFFSVKLVHGWMHSVRCLGLSLSYKNMEVHLLSRLPTCSSISTRDTIQSFFFSVKLVHGWMHSVRCLGLSLSYKNMEVHLPSRLPTCSSISTRDNIQVFFFFGKVSTRLDAFSVVPWIISQLQKQSWLKIMIMMKVTLLITTTTSA